MKLVRLFYVCFTLLVSIGCVKQEKEVQGLQNNTFDTIPENDSRIFVYHPDVRITLKSEDTKGVTDITEFFKEYLIDKTEEYFSRVYSISFHQNYSTEERLEHLGDLKMFPNLRYLTVSSNLTSVDIDGLPNTLETLDLSNNKIVTFNVNALPQELGVLNLSKNNLSSFSVNVFPYNLVKLDLSRNNLSSIDIVSLPQTLQLLYLSRNNISSFDGAALPKKVSYVDLSYNPIEERPVIDNVEVRFYNNPNSLFGAPKEDIDIKEIFRRWMAVPEDYSEEEKEEFLEKAVSDYLSLFIGYESIFDSFDALELIDSIARYLE